MIGDISTLAAPRTDSTNVVAAGGKMGKDEFLKLLVAQLKNQDPMSPQNGQELAAQLAQFSSLEQLTQIGQTMEAQGGYMQTMIDTLSATRAQAAVGKEVTANGKHVFVDEAGKAAVQFAVGGKGGTATLHLFDESGKAIGTRALGQVKPGEHRVDVSAGTVGLTEGWYSYKIEVVDGAGTVVPTNTFTTAIVDGVRYMPDGPVLTSGALTIPYEAVVQVR